MTIHAEQPATTEADAGCSQGDRATTTYPGLISVYPNSADSWRTWPEVAVTINSDIPALPCDYCGDMDSTTTVRVHQPAFSDDVCAACAHDVVRYAIDRHPDNHITQIEVTF